MRADGSFGRVAPGEHASADDLALFVVDALAAPARQRLEGHVASCLSCAAALAAEAAAEQALREVWPVLRQRARAPLAEVVALPRPAPRPAPAARSRPRVPQQGSLGGLAAAVVTVLFVGWWTDAGRLIGGGRIDEARAGAPLTACLLTGQRSIADDAQVRICAPAPPSLGAMASWGMCAAGAPAGPGGICRSLPDPICARPEGE
jgi:hypothetical protein